MIFFNSNVVSPDKGTGYFDYYSKREYDFSYDMLTMSGANINQKLTNKQINNNDSHKQPIGNGLKYTIFPPAKE